MPASSVFHSWQPRSAGSLAGTLPHHQLPINDLLFCFLPLPMIVKKRYSPELNERALRLKVKDGQTQLWALGNTGAANASPEPQRSTAG